MVISSVIASRRPWARSAVEAVGLGHQRAGADQQVAVAGARGDAGVAVVGGVGIGDLGAVPPFAGEEDALPGHEDAVEQAHRGALAVAVGEAAPPPRRAARRGAPPGQARRVDRHRAAHGVIGVGFGHRAARHHQQLVHVGPAGDDGLGAGNHDAVGAALDDMHVGIRVGLGVRPLRAVALGVGHGDADGEVGVADVLVVGLRPRQVLGAVFGVDRGGACRMPAMASPAR
jgi:hypothetical protein